MTGIFFNRIDGKQQQNDRRLCVKDMGENCSHLGGFLFLQVLVFRFLFFCSDHFLNILTGNNNKIMKNDVHMVWVQKQVILCWFVTFGSFRAKWPKLVSVIVFTCIDFETTTKWLKIKCKIFGWKRQLSWVGFHSEYYVQKIWVKIVINWGWFLFLAGFRI